MLALIVFLPLLTMAHILQDDVAITEKSHHSFKSVCSKMVTHESPLIDVVSGTELDCMGKKIKVGFFCEKELAQDPYYLRSYIDSEKKEVVCVSGKKVLFKYLCVKLSDRALCSQSAKTSCEFIQGKLAKRLDLVHASFVKNEKKIKQLNCFFESLPLNEKK
jgi:hypothetical protein